MTRFAPAAILAASLAAASCARGPAPADLLLTGASVYTLDWPDPDPEGKPAPQAPFDPHAGWHPDAQAVAVRGDTIVFVGTAGGAQAYRGADTRVMELGGATVIPGLIESHVHLVQLGAFLSQIDLVDVATEEEAVRLAQEKAATLPTGTWILGSGWDEGAWANRYPTLGLLSERVPDHPVYFRGLHGFAGWGNRLAFQRAGITAATPDPEGGRVVRDQAGNPTGVLLNRAILLLEDSVPAATVEETMDHVLAGLQVMAEHGYTSVHEAGADYRFPEEIVRRMIAAGFQAEIHAIGDGANRRTLELYHSVFQEHPDAATLRHKIVHAQVVHPDDFEGFAALGIAASVQPPHAVEDMSWAEERLGPERIRGAYAWRTLRRSGARLLLNSDLPGSDWDIFYGLHSAVTRRDKQLRPPGGWYPEQVLTPEEAVRGYTTWGAWAEFLDQVTGIIRTGMRADLTVLSLDPFVVGSTDPAQVDPGPFQRQEERLPSTRKTASRSAKRSVDQLSPAPFLDHLRLLLLVRFRRADDLRQRPVQQLADLLQAGHVDVGLGILQMGPDSFGVLGDGPFQVDRGVEMGTRAERLESLERLLVVVVLQVGVLVVHVGQLDACHGAVVEAHIAFPTTQVIVDVLDERTERGNPRA